MTITTADPELTAGVLPVDAWPPVDDAAPDLHATRLAAPPRLGGTAPALPAT